MKIQRYIGGTLQSNGYIIYNKKGGECYVIDPGYNPKVFINYINDNSLKLKGIILTHLHHDHTGAVDAISSEFNSDIYMHSSDAYVYKGKVDTTVDDGDKLLLEDEPLLIISTPGHTKGSICIMSMKSRVCFTGDTIFDTDLGRCDLAGGSDKDMKNTCRNIINRWDNDIIIYPGHDNGCTMKQVRKQNSEFLALCK